MFGNKNKSDVEVDSIIGKNTKIYGNIHFSGGLHIDGVVVGNVVAEVEGSTMTISERGRIEGDVTVHHVQLNGEVVGDVHALKQIELATNARVRGNVYYNIIEMAKGAEVNGNLIHGDPEQEKKHPTSQDQHPAAVATAQAEKPASQNAQPVEPIKVANNRN